MKWTASRPLKWENHTVPWYWSPASSSSTLRCAARSAATRAARRATPPKQPAARSAPAQRRAPASCASTRPCTSLVCSRVSRSSAAAHSTAAAAHSHRAPVRPAMPRGLRAAPRSGRGVAAGGEEGRGAPRRGGERASRRGARAACALSQEPLPVTRPQQRAICPSGRGSRRCSASAEACAGTRGVCPGLPGTLLAAPWCVGRPAALPAGPRGSARPRHPPAPAGVPAPAVPSSPPMAFATELLLVGDGLSDGCWRSNEKEIQPAEKGQTPALTGSLGECLVC